MGKGKRVRQARNTDPMTRSEKKAMIHCINQQLAAAEARFYDDELAIILWALHETFGFGKKRLARFANNYKRYSEDLKQHYELRDDELPYVARLKLLDIGVDINVYKRGESSAEGNS